MEKIDFSKSPELYTAFPGILSLYEDWSAASETINKDIEACFELVRKSPACETWKRLLIRTVFTSLDLFCNRLGLITLKIIEWTKATIPSEDIEFLRNNVSSDGCPTDTKEIKYGKKYLKTIEIYARLMKKELRIDNNSTEYKAFLKAIKIRNRLTHPKTANDLQISIDDYEVAAVGSLWATDLFRNIAPVRKGRP